MDMCFAAPCLDQYFGDSPDQLLMGHPQQESPILMNTVIPIGERHPLYQGSTEHTSWIRDIALQVQKSDHLIFVLRVLLPMIQSFGYIRNDSAVITQVGRYPTDES